MVKHPAAQRQEVLQGCLCHTVSKTRLKEIVFSSDALSVIWAFAAEIAPPDGACFTMIRVLLVFRSSDRL